MGARERRSNYQCLKLEILIACLVANLSSGYVVNGLPFSQPSSFTDSTPPWTAYPTRAQRRSQMQQQNQDEADEENVFSSLSERAGNAALDNVQMLASKVAESTGGSRTISSNSPRGYLRQAKARISKSDSATPGGTGGLVYNNKQYSTINKEEGGQSTAASAAPTTKESSSVAADLQVSPSSNKEDQVWTALANLELDSTFFSFCFFFSFLMLFFRGVWKLSHPLAVLTRFNLRLILDSWVVFVHFPSANARCTRWPKASTNSFGICNAKFDCRLCGIWSTDIEWCIDRILGTNSGSV